MPSPTTGTRRTATTGCVDKLPAADSCQPSKTIAAVAKDEAKAVVKLVRFRPVAINNSCQCTKSFWKWSIAHIGRLRKTDAYGEETFGGSNEATLLCVSSMTQDRIMST